jgi:transposase
MASRRAEGDHWTLDRVAAVIERLTGVSHYRGHVWKLLRHRQHYRLQRPARRATARRPNSCSDGLDRRCNTDGIV